MALQTGTDPPTTRRLTRTTEVTPMQLATLDREPKSGAAVADAFASLTALTGLSALAERVADEQLPCRANDPELFVQGVVVPRKRPRGRPRKSEVAA